MDLISAAPWIAVAASAAAALVPLLVEYGKQLWDAEHYQFYPLMPGAVAWLAWRRYQTPARPSRPISPAVRYGLWGMAFLTTAVSALAESPFGAAVALLMLIVAGLYEWGGSSTLRHYLPVCAVLLIILRLPFGLDQKMIVAMQRSATRWASGILDLANIRHLADGVVIRLPQGDFFVDEACSGVHSLFATLAFVAVFAVATRRGLLRFLPLFAAAVFWVLVANAVRVLAVVVLSSRYGLPVVEGFGHEALGVIVFATVIGLVLSTDRLLLFFLPQPEHFTASGTNGLESSRGFAGIEGKPRRGGIGSFAMATAFALVAIGIQLLPAGATPQRQTPYAAADGLQPVPKETLPKSWDGWEQVKFQVRERPKGDPAGEISRIWNFRKGRLTVAVSIDGPFDAWHDTKYCYEGLGYTTQSSDDITAPDGGTSPGAFTELTITNGGGRHGYVLFMAYTETGRPLSPPASRNASVARLVAAWKDRIAGQPSHDVADGRVYQVQLFAESGLNFTDAERADMARLFHQMRTEIARSTAPPTAAAKGETT